MAAIKPITLRLVVEVTVSTDSIARMVLDEMKDHAETYEIIYGDHPSVDGTYKIGVKK